MKYSKNFERDYKFYLENKDDFTFCGTSSPKFTAIYDEKGKSAKEVFYLIDSTGKNYSTYEVDLLNDLLLCKASVNFYIKQWAQGRGDATLTFAEFAGEGLSIEWIKDDEDDGKIKYRYKRSIAETYNFPDWVINAVESQKAKINKQEEL
jgi:hypothetical protein